VKYTSARCGAACYYSDDISRAECPNAIELPALPGGNPAGLRKFSGSQVVAAMKPLDWSPRPHLQLPDEQVMAEASEIKRSQNRAHGASPITVTFLRCVFVRDACVSQ